MSDATSQRGRVRVEHSPKRVRILLGGRLVADSTAARLVWENPHFPAYYLPRADVRTELLVPSARTERSTGDISSSWSHGPSQTTSPSALSTAMPEARKVSVRCGTAICPFAPSVKR